MVGAGQGAGPRALPASGPGLGGAILAQADADPHMPGFHVLVDAEARRVPGPPPQLVAQYAGQKNGRHLGGA